MRLIKSSFPFFCLLAIVLLSGCASLRHKQESKHEQSSSTQTGSQQSSSSVDTSKRVTTVRWRVSFPAANNFSDLDLPSFEPVDFTGLVDGSKEQLQAFSNLQKQYTSLRGAYGDLTTRFKAQGQLIGAVQGDLQGMIIDYEKQQTESLGRSQQTHSADSSATDIKDVKDESLIEKTVPWYQRFADYSWIISVVLIWFFYYKVWRHE